MAVDISIPSVGESVTDVIIDQWLVAEGAWVAVDTPLVSIETDKANVEVPAPVAGTLSKILKQHGEMATVGDVICQMEPGDKAASDASPEPAETPTEAATEPPPIAAVTPRMRRQ